MLKKGQLIVKRAITVKAQFQVYGNVIPLSKDISNAVPILLSDDEIYLSRYLNKTEKKYAISAGYFTSKVNTLLVPDVDGSLKLILIKPSRKKRFLIGDRIARLPSGKYKIKSELSKDLAFEVTLGFCLSSYRFQQFRKNKENCDVVLCLPENADEKKITTFSQAEFFARNLINMPASHLGPDNLENIIRSFAKEKGVSFKTIIGDDLLTKNFPMIHAVGKAGAESPRLVELNWGSPDHYKVTLVGKGVCFDTGGLNIKPSTSMGAMKKDMGGAASVLGLTEYIVKLKLKISLTVLIPIVENSISSQSFRPGDVLVSRKGLSVEVNNTDAEGRLILADALHYADEKNPNLLVCMATLTGAARVALGPDIVPFYSNDEDFSRTLVDCAEATCDPVWRLPFYSEYEHMIESIVADLDNAPKSGMAGSITAALFLKRFVENSDTFVHCDIFSWSVNAEPGRSVGGLMQGVRALCAALELRLNKH
ncbi:MAG: leucyl aminopeptidase family protein [Paracoccaceae bacterium]|nr:leucyl aminopeptidase family protein [Paracoccaceae bacterium]